MRDGDFFPCWYVPYHKEGEESTKDLHVSQKSDLNHFFPNFLSLPNYRSRKGGHRDFVFSNTVLQLRENVRKNSEIYPINNVFLKKNYKLFNSIYIQRGERGERERTGRGPGEGSISRARGGGQGSEGKEIQRKKSEDISVQKGRKGRHTEDIQQERDYKFSGCWFGTVLIFLGLWKKVFLMLTESEPFMTTLYSISLHFPRFLSSNSPGV